MTFIVDYISWDLLIDSIVSKFRNSGKDIQDALVDSAKEHVSDRYPGSKHWDPDKITEGGFSDGNSPEGIASIDIPGATRAYSDIDIKPRFRNNLTIPMHKSAYGKKATDFNDLILIKKKNGKQFLARKEGSLLAFMFYLSKGVHLMKDDTLLPSDETFAESIISRIMGTI